MTYILVLSRSITDTRAWSRANGFKDTQARHAGSAGSIVGGRPKRIVQLPSYDKRPDKHAINQAVRRLVRASKLQVEMVDFDPSGKAPHQTTIEEQIEIAESEGMPAHVEAGLAAAGKVAEGEIAKVAKAAKPKPVNPDVEMI